MLLKRIFGDFSSKIGKFFAKFKLMPNQWTLLSIIPVLISAHLLINKEFLAAGVFFAIASFIDVIDGAVARVIGKVTKRGAYLDTVIDRYVEGIILFSMLFLKLPKVFLEAEFWIFAALFGSLISTYVKAAAKEKELVIEEMRAGLIGRAERLLILIIGIFLAEISPIFLVYVLIFLAIISNIAALHRIYLALLGAAGI